MMKYLVIFFLSFSVFAYRPPIDDLMKNIQYKDSERSGAHIQMKIMNTTSGEIYQTSYYINDLGGKREILQDITFKQDGMTVSESIYNNNIFENKNLLLSLVNSVVKGDAIHLRNIFRVGDPSKTTTEILRKDKKFVWVNKMKNLTTYFDVMTKRLMSVHYEGKRKKINFSFKNYRMYNQTHIFPEVIEFSSGDQEYVARTTLFKFFDIGSKEYQVIQEKRKYASSQFGDVVPGIFR